MTLLSGGLNEVWIGLAEMRPIGESEILDMAELGYSNVLAFASDEESFRKKVAQLCASHNLAIVQIEDIEPLQSRKNHRVVDSSVDQVANDLTEGGVARFTTIHTFPKDE
jgi:hypothetical protein